MYRLISSQAKALLAFILLILSGIVIASSLAVDRVIEVNAMKAPSQPVIDGDTWEWPDKASITGYVTPADIGKTLQQWRGMAVPEKEGDCSLSIYALWDENNFYFAGRIIDEALFLDCPSGDPRGCATGEVFEFYMDPLDSRDAGRGFGGTFGGTDKGPILVQMDPLERIVDKALWEGAVVEAKRLGPHGLPGWSFELHISKEAFDPLKIKGFQANNNVGLTFMIKDDDAKDQNASLGAFDSVVQWPKGASDAIGNDSMAGLILSPEIIQLSAEVIGTLSTTWGRIKDNTKCWQ